MYRIPFRALGRPLSGKNGRFHNSPARVQVPVVETVEAVDPAPVVETVDPTPVVEPAPVVETVEVTDPEPATAVEAAPVGDPEPVVDQMIDIDLSFSDAIEWKPSWTKTQLLAVAQEKGLSVTASNTKAEIIAALTAAG